jgi:hypothetical protein
MSPFEVGRTNIYRKHRKLHKLSAEQLTSTQPPTIPKQVLLATRQRNIQDDHLARFQEGNRLLDGGGCNGRRRARRFRERGEYRHSTILDTPCSPIKRMESYHIRLYPESNNSLPACSSSPSYHSSSLSPPHSLHQLINVRRQRTNVTSVWTSVPA